MSDKKFDCLEIKRKAQEKIYEDIKDMTPDEEIEYFRHQTEAGPLGRWWNEAKKATADRKAKKKAG